MAPKHNMSGAGNPDMTKERHKTLSLSKKVKVLDLRKEKNHTYDVFCC
jgi:hypothetical protein